MIQSFFEGVWRTLLPAGRNSATRLNLEFLTYAAAFVSKWGLAWVVLTLSDPSWLPNSAAVNTTAEVLPAAMVSIFVFIFGSLFVVTQQAVSIHSNRASLLLLFDKSVQQIVIRALLIAVATLSLALLVPDEGTVPAVSAFATILVLATAFALAGAAVLLPSLMSRTTAPASFALFALQGVPEFLSVGATELVVYRVGALGEMLKRGVRNGDSLQMREALRGLQLLHDAYRAAAEYVPEIRSHQYEQGMSTGWLGEEMIPLLVSAGQESIAVDAANEDSNAIAIATAGFGMRSSEAGHREEFMRTVDGLGQMATCSQQQKGPAMVLHFSEPVFGLASLTQAAQNNLDDEAAAWALATWALAMAYAMRHLGGHFMTAKHPYWPKSLSAIGRDAPFRQAHQVVDSPEFVGKWANHLTSIPPEFDAAKQMLSPTSQGGAGAIHEYLQQAEEEVGQVVAETLR